MQPPTTSTTAAPPKGTHTHVHRNTPIRYSMIIYLFIYLLYVEKATANNTSALPPKPKLNPNPAPTPVQSSSKSVMKPPPQKGLSPKAYVVPSQSVPIGVSACDNFSRMYVLRGSFLCKCKWLLYLAYICAHDVVHRDLHKIQQGFTLLRKKFPRKRTFAKNS